MTKLKDVIEKIWAKYGSSLMNGNVTEWISLWADDGIQMGPNTPPRHGKQNIFEDVRNYLDLYECRMLTSNNEEVRETDSWGFARGSYSFEWIPKVEGEIIKGDGKFLSIFEKQEDGSWKIIRSCHNFNQ